jgi:probable rRNA maturation factor
MIAGKKGHPDKMNIKITVADGGDKPEPELIRLFEKAGRLVAAIEGLPESGLEADLSLVTSQKIRALNRIHRGKDQATDVLSFPQYDGVGDVKAAQVAAPMSMAVLLGDVVICRAKAIRQAKEYGHTVRRELAYLLVHSLFHLLGYDHPKTDPQEKRRMRTAEEQVMKSLGLEREEEEKK